MRHVAWLLLSLAVRVQVSYGPSLRPRFPICCVVGSWEQHSTTTVGCPEQDRKRPLRTVSCCSFAGAAVWPILPSVDHTAALSISAKTRRLPAPKREAELKDRVCPSRVPSSLPSVLFWKSKSHLLGCVRRGQGTGYWPLQQGSTGEQ